MVGPAFGAPALRARPSKRKGPYPMAFARSLLPAVLSLALTGVPAALPDAAAASAAAAAVIYDGQVRHETALFSVKSTNNAAAQEFAVTGTRLSRVSVWLASGAATGTVTAQIRRVRADAGSTIASKTLNLAALGGAEAGWVEFPVDAAVTPGTTYYLFLQATTAENKPIAWYGTTRSVPGSLTSWNYDRAYWGGWHAYASRLAFHVNPTGSERCGETEPCYVPASALAARTSGLLTNRVATEAVLPPSPWAPPTSTGATCCACPPAGGGTCPTGPRRRPSSRRTTRAPWRRSPRAARGWPRAGCRVPPPRSGPRRSAPCCRCGRC